MKPLLDLFNGDKEETKKFFEYFCGSVSDAVVFAKKFENAELAEAHLMKLDKECDEKADNSCGDNCKWIFDEKTKTLFIRGRGEMKDYGFKNGTLTTPWSSKREQIENIVISEGITTIGESAFWGCYSLTSIIIPNSVAGIGEYAFSECSSLTTATLPKRFENQKDDIFRYCDDLKTINWI